MTKNKLDLSDDCFWKICIIAVVLIGLLLIMGICIGDFLGNYIAYISVAVSIISVALVVITYLQTKNLTIELNEKNEQRVWERELLSGFPDIKSNKIEIGCCDELFGREILSECGLWIDVNENERYIWLKNGQSYDPGYTFTIRDVEISCDSIISNRFSSAEKDDGFQKLKKGQYHVLNGELLNIVLIGTLEKHESKQIDIIEYLNRSAIRGHLFKVRLKITSDFTNNKTLELMNFTNKKYTTGRVVWQYELIMGADSEGNKEVKVLSVEKHFPKMEGA